MTRAEQVSYLRVALALQKIVVNDETTDRIIETNNEVIRLKGCFSIQDAVDIELKMDRKYKNKTTK